jgi:hypothetical protein
MKTHHPILLFLFLTGLSLGACTQGPEKSGEETTSILGTWQLLSVLTIEGPDSIWTDYTGRIKGIKMFNETHFAFFQHDLNQGKESDSLYVSGGGPYTYEDGIYTEQLEYCNFRVYENNTFEFELSVSGDTMIQRGMEEVAEAGINKYIYETYVRID